MEVTSGDIVTVAMSGDYGKPRPALVVQDDAFAALESVTVLRLMQPSAANGLRLASQVMVDKAATIPRRRLGERIGRADASTMATINDALSRFLGLRT
jgi:mRNA interferase MazF